MANEVMQSLFGLSPYDVQQGLRQQQMAEDYRYAQLDPTQQIIFNARQAGRGIGEGVNQLFGLVPEPLQRARAIEGALKSVQDQDIDMSNPVEYYTAVAKALSAAGRHQEAAQVIAQMQSMLPTYMNAKTAQTRAEHFKEQSSVSERNRALMTKIEADIAAGRPVSIEDMLSAQLEYKRLSSDRQGINQFSGEPYTIPGLDLSKIYPHLAMVLAQVGPPTNVTTGQIPTPEQQPPLAVPPVVSTPPVTVEGAPTPEVPLAPEVQQENRTSIPAQPGVTTALPGNGIITVTPLAPLPIQQDGQTTPTSPPRAAVAPPLQPEAIVKGYKGVSTLPTPTLTASEKGALSKPVPPFLPKVFKNQAEVSRFNADMAVYNANYKEWLDQQHYLSDAQKNSALIDHQRNMEAIARSAEERQLRAEQATKLKDERARTASLRNVVEKSRITIDAAIAAAKLLQNYPRLAAGLGSLTNILPDTPAGQLATHLRTIKSNVVLNQMLELKAASPTGSTGFGAMNLEELRILVDSLGSLEQMQNSKLLAKTIENIAKSMFDAQKYAKEEMNANVQKKGK